MRAQRAVPVLVLLTILSACRSSPHAGREGGATTQAPAQKGPNVGPLTTSPASPVTSAAPVAPPPFASSVSTVSPADVPASWRQGCPVGPSELRLVTLSHWDFDGHPQAGRIVVQADVVDDVIAIFRRLYEQRFPIRHMEPVDAYGGSDDASMAADNTSAFNCRNAVASGPARWSVHAYGQAIDVNPVENPYVLGAQVMPPDGAAYADRKADRPGMATPGGDLVAAFAASGWQWGGRWDGSPDYQHFSANGG